MYLIISVRFRVDDPNPLYLNEGHVVVTASHADGTDDERECIYSTKHRRLAMQKRQFEASLEASADLMTIYCYSNGISGFSIRLERF